MAQTVTISDLMAESGVGFGTSGARGLVSQMTDRVCLAYVTGFLQYLEAEGRISPGASVAFGGDLRPSTPRILQAVAEGIRHAGYVPQFLGFTPSPAVALHGLVQKRATVMVTGSHIPADRNGMKFTTSDGEITKQDEIGIKRQQVTLPTADLGAAGNLLAARALPPVEAVATEAYLERYLAAFPHDCLRNTTLGVYGHSAVGRDLLARLYRALGAEVLPLGYADEFIPVDTEAIRPEDAELAAGWAKQHALDAIVSTDGDSDRPLLADERGRFLRGDVMGIIVARFFGADGVATPVSCNGALEISGAFPSIERTKIGSPFVIAGMAALAERSAQRIVGYEANGGFLHRSPLEVPGGGTLAPLPTRDAVIVHLAVLLAARAAGGPVSALAQTLPARFTASARDQSFAKARSATLMGELTGLSLDAMGPIFGLGTPIDRSTLDGTRLTFPSGEVIHLRPSGNAPELRCYAEAETPERAAELVDLGISAARALAPGS